MVNRGMRSYDDKSRRRQRLALRKKDKTKRLDRLAAKRRDYDEEEIPFYQRDYDDNQ